MAQRKPTQLRSSRLSSIKSHVFIPRIILYHLRRASILSPFTITYLIMSVLTCDLLKMQLSLYVDEGNAAIATGVQERICWIKLALIRYKVDE